MTLWAFAESEDICYISTYDDVMTCTRLNKLLSAITSIRQLYFILVPATQKLE